MGKPPAFQFYTGDWLKDPSLGMCSPATRGVWIDLMCVMHERNRSGLITGTREQIARICRCTVVELDAAITELQTTSAADITTRDSVVTITCRRMKREADERKAASERKRRQRSRDAPDNVTPKSRSYSSTSSSSSNNNHPPPPISAPSADGGWSVVVDSLKSLGIVKTSCVDAAREAGCKPDHVSGLVDHWERHHREIGWNSGALVHRIQHAAPGMAIAEGWPPGKAAKVEQPVEDWKLAPDLACPECGKTHRGNKVRRQTFQCVRCVANFELDEVTA